MQVMEVVSFRVAQKGFYSDPDDTAETGKKWSERYPSGTSHNMQWDIAYYLFRIPRSWWIDSVLERRNSLRTTLPIELYVSIRAVLEEFPAENSHRHCQRMMPKSWQMLVPLLTPGNFLEVPKAEQPFGWSPMLNMNLGPHAMCLFFDILMFFGKAFSTISYNKRMAWRYSILVSCRFLFHFIPSLPECFGRILGEPTQWHHPNIQVWQEQMKSSTVHNLTEVDRLGPDPVVTPGKIFAQKNTSLLGICFLRPACMIVYVNIDTAILV